LFKSKRVFYISIFALIASFFPIHEKEASAATQIENGLYIMESVSIIIDHTSVTFEDPILNKEGSLLLPMREFYETIGAKVTWNQTTQTASAFKNENRLDLTINSGIGMVNGAIVPMDVAPLIYESKTYVPLRFVSENLEGKVNWYPQEQLVDIQLDAPIDHEPPSSYQYNGDFIGKSFGATASPTHVPNVRLEGNRQLLVSDNPETLTEALVSSDNVTLAEHHIQSSSETNLHRVFGWHLNKLGQDVTIGITIENKSKRHSLEVTSSKGAAEIDGTDSIIYDVGLQIADDVLSENLKETPLSGTRIRPGETKTIKAYSLKQGQIIGMLHDIDIRSLSSGESEYTIRTVLSKTKSDLSKIHSYQVPVDSNRQHPRGAWPHSTIVADLPAYTVGSEEVGYSFSNKTTDYLLTGANSLSKLNGAVGNYGHYGMNYQVNIPIINPTGEEKTVKLRLSGRGGWYSGAVKINGEVYLIPILTAMKEHAKLPEYKITEETETISLEIMHAGGSSLPLALYVEAEE
jgi:hypothetical protein